MFAFARGQKGNKGDKGDQGDKGDKGDQGDPGTYNFVDRGDPASGDFAVGDLTTDAAYHDLDLTAAGVPANGVALVKFSIKATSADKNFRFRKKGNSNDVAMTICHTIVANLNVDGIAIVPCDANSKIEYKASNTTWTSIDICVLGWWV